MTSFLNPLYWLSLEPAVFQGWFGKSVLGFFFCLVLAGIVIHIVSQQKTTDRYQKRIGERVVSLCLTMGFLGLLLFFFSYEGIRFFGARFWYPLWDLGLLVWIACIVRYVMKDVPVMKEKNAQQHAKSKYLSGRRK